MTDDAYGISPCAAARSGSSEASELGRGERGNGEHDAVRLELRALRERENIAAGPPFDRDDRGARADRRPPKPVGQRGDERAHPGAQ